jgi:hypothetical protein
MAKLAVKVGGELATVWSGRRCLAPLEKDRMRGRSFVERQTRCRFLRGSWCTFYRGQGRGVGSVKAGNLQHQCLGLKAPLTRVLKSRGGTV